MCTDVQLHPAATVLSVSSSPAAGADSLEVLVAAAVAREMQRINTGGAGSTTSASQDDGKVRRGSSHCGCVQASSGGGSASCADAPATQYVSITVLNSPPLPWLITT